MMTEDQGKIKGMEIKAHGKIKVLSDINYVKQVLIKEGFYDPGILQIWKEGQVFGLAKRINKVLETHVRGYADNTFDAEIEISRDFLEHLSYEGKPFYGYLVNILKKYNIPFQIIDQLPPDPTSVEVPEKLTRWKPVVSFLILLLLLAESNKENKKKHKCP